MKRWTQTLIVAGTLSVMLATPMHAKDKAQDTELKPQSVCPVMGGKVNKNSYADVKGKRIYVCCAGCIPAIKKNPEKYIKKLEADGITVATIQTTCPVMGGKINTNSYADVEGKRIYVCCAGCIPMIKKNPEKYIEQMESEGIVIADTPGPAAKKTDK